MEHNLKNTTILTDGEEGYHSEKIISFLDSKLSRHSFYSRHYQWMLHVFFSIQQNVSYFSHFYFQILEKDTVKQRESLPFIYRGNFYKVLDSCVNQFLRILTNSHVYKIRVKYMSTLNLKLQDEVTRLMCNFISEVRTIRIETMLK